MSDKKQPKQSKSDDKTSAASSNVEKQAGLSASIKISTPNDVSSEKPDTVDTNEKSLNKETTAQSKSQTEPSSNKNNEKSATPLKNSASTTSSKPVSAGTKTPTDKSTVVKSKKNKISKVAVFALIIALLAILASAGHFYWNEQQKAQYSQQLSDLVERKLIENQQKIAQQLTTNAQSVNQKIIQQFSQNKRNSANEISALVSKVEQISRIESSNQNAIAQVQQKLASLGQKQPSDWLLQEAEYLIRVASRSLWLEKTPRTAVSLLQDAELRIQELNDPQFLSLRQTIQQDIAQLKLLPTLATDEVILKLMVLDQHIKQLPMALFEIPEMYQTESSLELTDNATDWRENLAKTWHKFTNEFFTVTRRTGNIEPLMSPQFQQNLRENLSLKVQTAIWAASKSNSKIYLQSLSATERWINEYFDLTKIENQHFLDTINTLKTATINVDYPNKLASLQAIRQVLSDKESSALRTLESSSNVEIPTVSEDQPPSAEQSEDL